MSADRKAVPIPKATINASFESGRAMSGRIGIILASTVSRVIDVPATHSSGVEWTWPASTVAISSSVGPEDRRRPEGAAGLVRRNEHRRGDRRRRRSRARRRLATSGVPQRRRPARRCGRQRDDRAGRRR